MKKRKLFLIIGLTKESGHWDDNFVEKLKEDFKTDNLVAFDIPGNGKFIKEQTPKSITKIVEKMRTVYLNDINTDADTENILISISLGGMIATEWTRLYPNDFNRMVIVNSSFSNLSPVYKRVQPKAMKTFFKIILTKSHEKREQMILDMCVNNKNAHQKTHEKWVQIAKTRPVSEKNMIIQTYAGSKYKVDHKPNIPVYIIAAKHDKLAHFSCSKKIHDKWGGDFTLIDDETIGHGVHIDAPDKLSQLICDWCVQ